MVISSLAIGIGADTLLSIEVNEDGSACGKLEAGDVCYKLTASDGSDADLTYMSLVMVHTDIYTLTLLEMVVKILTQDSVYKLMYVKVSFQQCYNDLLKLILDNDIRHKAS